MNDKILNMTNAYGNAVLALAKARHAEVPELSAKVRKTRRDLLLAVADIVRERDNAAIPADDGRWVPESRALEAEAEVRRLTILANKPETYGQGVRTGLRLASEWGRNNLIGLLTLSSEDFNSVLSSLTVETVP